MLDLNEKMFNQKVYQNKESCVVFFSKSTCHICQQVAPMIENLEQEYSGKQIHFYNVDADLEKELMERLSLKGVPQVAFFQKGDFGSKLAGIRDESDYKEKIEELLR